MGSDLTRPFIAATEAEMIAFVWWIASRMVASECHIMACDATTAMIKADSTSWLPSPQRRGSHRKVSLEFGRPAFNDSPVAGLLLHRS